jgi:3-hydroxyacyl-CoA dehydrogenase/3-hydroxy-2-methylbutyryl-CoA dehydrogenase
MEIKGTVAVVTGGASGLGEACVRELAEHGAKVAILDVAQERGEEIANEMGDAVRFYYTDITDEKRVQAAIDGTIDAFGYVHIAINCAGVGTPAKVLGKDGPMPMDQFNRTVQINLMGTMNVIRFSALSMVKNQGNEDGEKGVIINTASVAAFEGQVGQAAYSASKAAVAGMTLPIAREFTEYGIRVVTIVPGLFDTPLLDGLPENVKESLGQMIPFPRRLGRPREYALLATQIIENPMLNGTTIRLDAALRMAAK